jgi:hypothetical protein
MSRSIQNILIVFIATTLALVVGEVALHVSFRPEATQFIDDPILVHRALPGGEWDALGYRNEHVPATTTVLILGDSMVQGMGVGPRETFPYMFSEITSTSVYQMGLFASGPMQYWYRLTHGGLDLQPRIVVAGLTMGNDFFDSTNLVYNTPWWSFARNPEYEHANVPLTDSEIRTQVLSGEKKDSFMYRVFLVRNWLRNNVRLYALVGNATRTLRERLHLARDAQEQRDRTNILDESVAFPFGSTTPIATILSPSYRMNAIDPSLPSVREGMRLAMQAFSWMNASTTAAGGVFVVAIIPTKEKVYAEHMANVGMPIPASLQRYREAEALATSEMLSACTSSGIRCFSMEGDLVRALDDGKPVYKAIFDGHPPALGYRVYAESLLHYLQTHS